MSAASYTPHRPGQRLHLPVRLHRYHLHRWGPHADHADAPPLLLLHGWMDVGASYQFMVDALSHRFAARRRILAPDWRGFGHTHGPACDHYHFADYLGDLDALLEHIAGDGPVDLIGHSMGGHIAMLYAGARPDRIRRLVNLEGFGLPATRASQAPARYAQWLNELRALRRGDKRMSTYADASAVAARLMRNNPRLPPDKAHWLAHHWAEPRPQPDGSTRWHILGDAAHRIVNPQLFRVDETLALYAAITAPVLMVLASDDSLAQWWGPQLTRAEVQQRMQTVPRLRWHTLPDCGHMLHHDQPQALARLIEDFLTQEPPPPA